MARLRTDAHATRGYVLTESRAPVVQLTAARLDLLSSSTAAGVRTVLATDEPPLLTPAFAEVWRESGGCWVVRSPDGGLRDGFTGRRLNDVADVLRSLPTSSTDDVAVNYLRPMPSDALELVVSMALRHRRGGPAPLGVAVERLSDALLDEPPRAWGVHEPVRAGWDRDAIVALEDAEESAECRIVVSGPRLAATSTFRRTTRGVDEILRAHVNLGVPREVDLAAAEADVLSTLAQLAVTSTPTVALVLVRPARADLLVPPVLQHAASPLALLLGSAALRSPAPDRDRLRDLGGLPVGPSETAGMIFPLGSPSQEAWPQLDHILAVVSRRRPDVLLPLHPVLAIREHD